MSKEKEELILLEVSLRIIAFKTLNKSAVLGLKKLARHMADTKSFCILLAT